jgi:hypothetical protein
MSVGSTVNGRPEHLMANSRGSKHTFLSTTVCVYSLRSSTSLASYL